MDRGVGQHTFSIVTPALRSVEGVIYAGGGTDSVEQNVSCRQVSRTFPGANGLTLWKDRLFVGDSKNGTVTIFQIHDDKSLTELLQVVSGQV